MQRTSEAYWFTTLPSEKAVYMAYNRCAEDPARPMEAFLSDVFAALESADAKRLVVDLRHNGGGNSAVLSRFVPELASHPRLAVPGSLRVLIGPQTFSAAMHNAQELRDGARARLIGEPTGGKPNAYGEVRIFGLPRSGLAVFHSTQYSRAVEDDPPAVEPDVLVQFTSADAFAGADPALERALVE
jgi:C-terminal processing protease CtpA/Prc